MGYIGTALTVAKSFFFGNRKAGEGDTFAQEAARGIGNWVDERKFTEEEKAKADQKTLETILAVYKVDAAGSSTRSQARRELMYLFSRAYLLILFGAAILYRHDKAWSEFLLDLAHKTYLGEIVLAAASFYFLTNLTRSITGKSE